MKTVTAILLTATVLTTTGCGTLLVRGQDDFKGRLYPATVIDSCEFVDGCCSSQPGLAVQSGLSFPFDLVIDTVCLPFDIYGAITKETDLTLEQRRELRDKRLKEQEKANNQTQNIGTNAPNSDL